MDSRTFDNLSRKIANRMSRRRALAGSGLGITAAMLGSKVPSALAQGATPVADSTDGEGVVEVLFVQTFSSATIQVNPANASAFTITLMDGTGQTVYFSDRPERLAGTVTDEQFVDGRAFDPANPPNAAIVTFATDNSKAVLIVELTEPAYDPGTGAITYTATELQGQPEGDVLASLAARRTDTDLGDSFGPVTLFIDQLACLPNESHCTNSSDCCSDFCCGDPLDCGAGSPSCQ
jgi:hypothetical protein